MKVCWLSLLVLCAFPLWAKEKLTFRQVYIDQGRPLLQQLPVVESWLDGHRYFEIRQGCIFLVEARNGHQEKFLDPADHPQFAKMGIEASDPEDHTADMEKLVYSHDKDLWLFLRAAGKILRISAGPGEEMNPTFSPNGRYIAFTLDGNLWFYDTVNASAQSLTADGSEVILNGRASWIYYEEVLGRGSAYRAFWWSPDSRRIVFLRFDQTQVPIFPLYDASGDYGSLESQRYPKPGYPNPQVRLGIAEVANRRVTWIPCKDENDHYLAFPRWSSSGNLLYFEWLNRDQNHLRIFRFDLVKQSLATAYEERQRCWIDFLENGHWHVLSNGELLLLSSRDGWNHLYLVGKNGSANQLTAGSWPVESICHVDEKGGVIYFMARRESTTDTDLYRLALQGGPLTRLSNAPGSHYITMSRTGEYYLDTFSDIRVPSRLELHRASGKLLRQLGDRRTGKFADFDLAQVEMFRMPTSDGWQLPALWYLPPGFDRQAKYPVLLSIYGGPGTFDVDNSFGRNLGNHYLASLGIIVCKVDHRGSGHFGKKGMELMYRALGKWEMNDYIEAVKYLGRLPFIDAKRIGITGGSYGGYVTALALTYAADYFSCGIADSGVIDWRLYDSVYTERYMDTPQENPDGYRQSSVLTYVDKYRGGLLITHGTLDDNVHMQNTLRFLNDVIDAEKPLEFMLYPGQRHGYRGKKSEYARRADIDFWLHHFFGRSFGEAVVN